MRDANSRLVYSTDTGRIEEPKEKAERPKGDGIVRIQRQTSGRKGKGVQSLLHRQWRTQAPAGVPAGNAGYR